MFDSKCASMKLQVIVTKGLSGKTLTMDQLA